MKLNVGSNEHSIEGYLNVDIVPRRNVDIVADACNIPLDDGTVDEIYAGHLLEHLPRPIDFFLECHRLLKDRGTLTIVIPDICHTVQDRNIVIGVLFGFWLDEDGNPAPDNPEGMHRTFWSLETLRRVAYHCGFRYSGMIDPYDDPRLTAGADWQVGAEFIKDELNPDIVYANIIYKSILDQEMNGRWLLDAHRRIPGQ